MAILDTPSTSRLAEPPILLADDPCQTLAASESGYRDCPSRVRGNAILRRAPIGHYARYPRIAHAFAIHNPLKVR